MTEIERLVLHPDYWEKAEGNWGNPFDVALIQTEGTLYESIDLSIHIPIYLSVYLFFYLLGERQGQLGEPPSTLPS